VESTTIDPLLTVTVPFPVPDSAGEALGLSTQREQFSLAAIEAVAEAPTCSDETPITGAKAVWTLVVGRWTRTRVGVADESAEMQLSVLRLSGL
jgi:hypothetical protein